MKNALGSVGGSLKKFFGKLSRKEIIRLIILAVVIITLSIVIATVLSKTNYVVLYSGLGEKEAGEVLAELQARGVPTQTQGTGTILVPEDRVDTLRMQLAADGVRSDDIDYSFYLNYATGMGVTDQDKRNINNIQLAMIIQQHINKMARIESSSVVVNIPPESSYVLSNNNSVSTATIIVQIAGGGRLTNTEADAIFEAAASAIPNCGVDNISLSDMSMYIYKYGGEEDAASLSIINEHYAMEQEQQSRFELAILNLLTPVFGDYIRATCRVGLNFDKETVQSVEFSPPVEDAEEGLIVSIYELYEAVRNDELEGGVPGTDTNGLGTVEYPYGELGEDGVYHKAVREANYELNEIVTMLEKESGRLEFLSLAVLLDSNTMAEDYTEEVRSLVTKAIGVSDANVSVEYLPFQDLSEEMEAAHRAQEEYLESVRSRELLYTLINGAIILLLVLAILLFVRSIIRTIFGKKEEEERERAMELAMAGGPGSNYDFRVGDDGVVPGSEDAETDEEGMMVRNEELEMLEKFIDRDPATVAQLLRNWLTDD